MKLNPSGGPDAEITVTREDGSTYIVHVPKALLRAFEKECEKMRKLLEMVQKHAPEAGLYLQEDTPHLMCGPTHGVRGTWTFALQENVIATGVNWPRSGGGGW